MNSLPFGSTSGPNRRAAPMASVDQRAQILVLCRLRPEDGVDLIMQQGRAALLIIDLAVDVGEVRRSP